MSLSKQLLRVLVKSKRSVRKRVIIVFDYKALQNGSDIRGIALDGVPGEQINLGKEETLRLTRGFVIWLQDKTGKSAGR